MKRFPYILLSFLTACSMAVPEDSDPQVIMAFEPVVSPMTRGNDLPGNSVGVSIWTLDKNLNWVYGCEAEDYLTESMIVPGEDGQWYLEDMNVWPSVKKSITVIGYAPYDRVYSCCDEYGVRFSGVNVLDDQTPLMYTQPQADLHKLSSGGLVFLPLQHALCQLDFKVRERVAEGEDIRVGRIVLDNAFHEGDFRSLPQPEWEVSGTASEVEFQEGQSRLMIPQKLCSQVTVEYEYTNAAGLSIVQTVKTREIVKDLKPGYCYTLVLTVGVDDVKFLIEIL